MSRHLTPLEVVEAVIGKPEALGPICGINAKAPYGWRQPAGPRKAGDIPHTAHMRALLEHSDKHQLGLTPAHLIFGATAEEVEAILAQRGSRLEAAE